MPKPNKNEPKQNLARRYWQKANGLTAFAVTSMIAYLYALGTPTIEGHMVKLEAKLFASVGSVLFGVGFFAAIDFFGRVERKLLGNDSFLKKTSTYETWGRKAIIVMTVPFELYATWLF